MKDDNELMNLVKQGDTNAFEEIVLRHRLSALRFARNIIKDEFLAEDIIQESFAMIYINRDKYKNNYKFKTYLYTIVRNKCIDFLRKRKELNLEMPEEKTGDSVEDIIVKREEHKLFEKNFNSLNKDYKLALYLFEYEDMSYKEIAQVMKKSVPQIKILMYRARKKLKAIQEGVR